MRKGICLLMIVISSALAQGQTPGWAWAKSAEGFISAGSNSIATDVNENSYVTGCFSDSAITFGNITLTNSPPYPSAMYVVKYDVAGNVIWAKKTAGNNNDCGNSIAVDASGNSYITGYFNSDTIMFDTIALIRTGTTDFFIARYDVNGNAVWAKSGQGNSIDIAKSIAIDNHADLYITGSFYSDSISFDNTILIKATPFSGGDDLFIFKMDSSGTVTWGKGAGGAIHCEPKSIAVDENGYVYVTGDFNGSPITFDTISIINNSGGNFNDFFIAKYDASGNAVWAKGAGGQHSDTGFGITPDANGNAYVTGQFLSPSIVFDTITLTNPGPIGLADFFVAKYNSDGSVVWAKRVGGASWDYGNAITSAADGSIYIVGGFENPTIVFGNDTLTNAGTADIFVVKYDTSGMVVWAKSAGGSSADFGGSIKVSQGGNAYLSGYFISTALSFGNTTLLNPQGNANNTFFIAKLDSVFTTGLAEESNLSHEIIIYPNPTTSYFTFVSPINIDQIEITDVMGRVVYRTKLKSKTAGVRLDNEGSILLQLF